MKKVFLSALISLVCFCMVSAQDDKPASKSNELALSAFHIFDNTFQLNFEHHFQKNSLFFAAGLTLKQNEAKEKTGGRAELQYRFYSRPKKSSGYKGIYVGPYFQYKYLDMLYYYEYYKYETQNFENKRFVYSSMSGGFMGGIKLAIASTVYFDFSIGCGVRFSDKKTEGDEVSDYIYDNKFVELGYTTGVMPRANFTLGVGF